MVSSLSLSLIDVHPRSLPLALPLRPPRPFGKRDPPGPGPEAPAGPPSSAAAPAKMGTSCSSSPGPPLPYPYPYPYPFPITEHEPERECEYPHEFHGHEELICTTNSLLMSILTILMMISLALARVTTVYPMRTIPARIRMAISVIMTYTHSIRSIAVYTMTFLAIIILAFKTVGTTITKGHLPSREGQCAGGPEIATDNKLPNAISLPQASSVDLASAQLPPRAEPEVPDASNASPSVSSLFSELGSRGSTVPANLPRFVAREDDPLPLPNSMSLGSFQARGTKGNEVNEVAVEDRRTNPVEKLVTL
ncbi:hypothetical protein EI94DRAFT_1801790 [Lactarius quietus]|nr:hypothetical protein EI94DRAFT_1801790 [Lactarius quietus]